MIGMFEAVLLVGMLVTWTIGMTFAYDLGEVL